MSVIHNMQCLESTLRKKSNKFCYHAIDKSVAMGESRTGHVATAENPANLATKIITSQPKQAYLINKLLYDIYDTDK